MVLLHVTISARRCQPTMSENLLFAATTLHPSQSEMSTSADIAALDRAREKNEAVKENIEQSAQELMVINAVLKQEIPDHVQTGDLAQALEKSDAIEDLIHETVGDLAEVNLALEQEIGERAELERELAHTKVALALAQAMGKPLKR